MSISWIENSTHKHDYFPGGLQHERIKTELVIYIHAWAVRTIFYDLPDTVAARMMGHSVSLHTQTYHHWITKRDQQLAVNNALLKVKRVKNI